MHPEGKKSKQDIQNWLISKISSQLNIDPSLLNPIKRFNDYGLESAQATGLITELSKLLERPLPPTLVWDYPSIKELSDYLAARGKTPLIKEGEQMPAPTSPQNYNEPIAVIGMSCRFPGGANTPEAYWNLLMEGRAAVTEVPPERFNINEYYDPNPDASGKMNTRQGGFLGDIQGFDAEFFNISANEAKQMDPQQRLMLELSYEALEDAGLAPDSLKGSRTAVYFGIIWNDYANLIRTAGSRSVQKYTATGTHFSIVANRVSYFLGLEGPSMAIDTASSSSLVSIHQACQSLRIGESTMALAGGVNLMITPDAGIALNKLGTLAPDGKCKAFDAAANGYVRGEGGGVVLLKSLSQAIKNGDNIYAVIRGSAVNNDGFSNGLTSPNPAAQQRVLELAYENANIPPERVQYIETHGTGTNLGDPIEANAIGRALGGKKKRNSPILIGSVKTNIGHLEAAAGIAGFIKLALSIKNKQIPPSLNYTRPNPGIDFETLGIEVSQKRMDWPDSEKTALGGVSSFGFGGTNCHMVLEEYPLAAFAAPTPTESAPENIVFVFSGNGGQWPRMGVELLHEPIFQANMSNIDRLFYKHTGRSLLDDIMRDRDDSNLNQLEIMQPALFAIQSSLFALWKSRGIEPAIVLGHSGSEITAAHAAGILSLEDAVALVYHRSRLQQRLTGKGLMALVELPRNQTEAFIKEHKKYVSVSACNGPHSTLLSGKPDKIREIIALLEQQNIKSRLVSAGNVAAHSPQMDEIKDEFYDSIKDIRALRGNTRIISTVHGRELDSPEFSPYHWVRNIRNPVLFLQAIETSLKTGFTTFLEISPHPVLSRSLQEILTEHKINGEIFASMSRDESPGLTMEKLLRTRSQADVKQKELETKGILTLAAHSPWALGELIRDFSKIVNDKPEISIDGLCFRAATVRSRHQYRLALPYDSREQLGQDLARLNAQPSGQLRSERLPIETEARLVFIFSDSDSRISGMGRELYNSNTFFRETLQRCDYLMDDLDGWSIIDQLFSGDEFTSGKALGSPGPILFSIQAALSDLWNCYGVIPQAVMGIGRGEVAAAYTAGILDLETAMRIIHHGGKVLEQSSDNPEPNWLELSEQFKNELGPIRPEAAGIPFYTSIEGRLFDKTEMGLEYWARNLQKPDFFKEQTRQLIEDGYNIFLELGPHPILKTSAEQIFKETRQVAKYFPAFTDEQNHTKNISNILCELFENNLSPEWSKVLPVPLRYEKLPPYPWQRKPYWLDL